MRAGYWAGAILAAAIAGPAAGATDPTGVWVVKGDFGPAARYTMVCALKAEAGKLAGPCTGVYGALISAGGTLDSDRLNVSYLSDYQGNDVTMTDVGRRQSDGWYHGEIQAGPTPGAFNAQPIADWPEAHVSAWYVNAGISGGLTWNLGCGFKRTGRTLRGPCFVALGPPADTTGTVDGDNVAFGHDTVAQGHKRRLEYTGVLQANGSLSGTVRDGMGTGTFTATRR